MKKGAIVGGGGGTETRVGADTAGGRFNASDEPIIYTVYQRSVLRR